MQIYHPPTQLIVYAQITALHASMLLYIQVQVVRLSVSSLVTCLFIDCMYC